MASTLSLGVSFLLFLSLFEKRSHGLDVFLVPHSHCDAGYLLTADQYFAYEWPGVPVQFQGSWGSVRSALDTIVQCLAVDPSLRFSWSESIWLMKWWDLQTPDTQQTFRQLVLNGQIQFVGGGYVQNDETLVTYSDVIDQMTVGHEFLLQQFNVSVNTGWQLDMFSGYSGATPTLWALMGFSEMVLRFAGTANQRIEWEANKSFEFVWQASGSIPSNRSQIFAHVINGNYPDLMVSGFDWENTYLDPSRNPPINSSNVQERAELFVNYLTNTTPAQCSVYRGFPSTCMILWGADFRFHDAQAQFSNMSLIVDYINSHSDQYNMTVRFATPAEYFAYLHSLDLSYPAMVGGDFEYGWPHVVSQYGPNTTTYQTGTTSSWPAYKQLIRDTDSIARAAETAYATTVATKSAVPGFDEQLYTIRTGRALCQHHDSIPGTMRTNVSNNVSAYLGNSDVKTDYSLHLLNATEDAAEMLAASVGLLAQITTQATPNLTMVGPTTVLDGYEQSTLVVYSSLPWETQRPVSFLVRNRNVRVLDHQFREIYLQVEDEEEGAFKFVFIAFIPPMGFSTFFIDPLAADAQSMSPPSSHEEGSLPCKASKNSEDPQVPEYDIVIENGAVRAVFDSDSGLLKQLVQVSTNVSTSLIHQMGNYINGTGGAYILYETNAAVPVAGPDHYSIDHGPVFTQFCQYYDSYRTHVNEVCFRLYYIANGTALVEQFLEVTHDLGPLDTAQEIISRFTSDLDTNGTYWIDESNYEFREKQYDPTLPIPGNYHPLVGHAFIRDSTTNRDLSIIADRSMGVTSLMNGQVEVLMHRRTNSSDAQGPWPLNDTAQITVRTLVLFGDSQSSADLRKQLDVHFNNKHVLLASSDSMHTWITTYHTQVSALAAPLPPNLNIQTFAVRAPVSDESLQPVGELVLRFHHLYEVGESQTLSQPVTLDLSTLFNGFSVVSFDERTLSLSQEQAAVSRRAWPIDPSSSSLALESMRRAHAREEFSKSMDRKDAQDGGGVGDTVVTVNPLDFRSFLVSH